MRSRKCDHCGGSVVVRDFIVRRKYTCKKCGKISYKVVIR